MPAEKAFLFFLFFFIFLVISGSNEVQYCILFLSVRQLVADIWTPARLRHKRHKSRRKKACFLLHKQAYPSASACGSAKRQQCHGYMKSFQWTVTDIPLTNWRRSLHKSTPLECFGLFSAQSIMTLKGGPASIFTRSHLRRSEGFV